MWSFGREKQGSISYIVFIVKSKQGSKERSVIVRDLNHDIQNILDYNEWRNFSQLYYLAIKAEHEVQGRKQHQTFSSNNGRNFQQCSELEELKISVAPQPSTPAFSSGVSKLSNVQPPQLKKGPHWREIVGQSGTWGGRPWARSPATCFPNSQIMCIVHIHVEEHRTTTRAVVVPNLDVKKKHCTI